MGDLFTSRFGNSRKYTSPWGVVQHQEEYGLGIVQVSTASHGGFWVDAARRREMPACLARIGEGDSSTSGAWFEEDCACAAVIVSFPDRFPTEEVAAAWATLKNWYPEAYAEHHGVPVEVPKHLQELREWMGKNMVLPSAPVSQTSHPTKE